MVVLDSQAQNCLLNGKSDGKNRNKFWAFRLKCKCHALGQWQHELSWLKILYVQFGKTDVNCYDLCISFRSTFGAESIQIGGIKWTYVTLLKKRSHRMRLKFLCKCITRNGTSAAARFISSTLIHIRFMNRNVYISFQCASYLKSVRLWANADTGAIRPYTCVIPSWTLSYLPKSTSNFTLSTVWFV